MPTMNQLFAIAVLSGLCALVVTLVLMALGLGEHAPIAAAVSAAAAASVASISQSSRGSAEKG